MEKRKQYILERKHLVRFRAKLVLKLDRDLSWTDFSELVGVSYQYTIQILCGTRRGGNKYIRQIIEGMAKHGIMVHMADFEVD